MIPFFVGQILIFEIIFYFKKCNFFVIRMNIFFLNVFISALFDLVSKNPTCAREALGSRLELTYRDSNGDIQKQFVEKTLVNGFSAQGDSRIHFGMGDNATLVELKVNWCGSEERVYRKFELNNYLRVEFL